MFWAEPTRLVVKTLEYNPKTFLAVQGDAELLFQGDSDVASRWPYLQWMAVGASWDGSLCENKKHI